MNLVLHDYRRCPFCIRVRIILYLKGVNYIRVHEPLREWTEWMRENIENPRVPILCVQDSSEEEIIIPESNDINIWLDMSFGSREYTPETGSKNYQNMEKWFDWCADIFKPQIDLYKYGENRVFDEKKHIYHTEDLRMMIMKIESRLQDSNHLVGKKMTLADIAVIPFIRQIMRTRNGEFDFSDYPKVISWSNEVLGQRWFDDIVMKKK